MPSKKKTETPVETPVVETITEKEPVIIEEKDIIPEEEAKKLKPEEVVDVKAYKVEVKQPKYSIGSIVYISKDAEADLNGFKLFPQYKKYTYTVEAYDEDTGVYSLRRLNLSLKLKEELILAPNERAHDSLNRKQF